MIAGSFVPQRAVDNDKVWRSPRGYDLPRRCEAHQQSAAAGKQLFLQYTVLPCSPLFGRANKINVLSRWLYLLVHRRYEARSLDETALSVLRHLDAGTELSGLVRLSVGRVQAEPDDPFHQTRQDKDGDDNGQFEQVEIHHTSVRTTLVRRDATGDRMLGRPAPSSRAEECRVLPLAAISSLIDLRVRYSVRPAGASRPTRRLQAGQPQPFFR
jgi:hypothetical protein